MAQNTNPWGKSIDPLAQDVAAVLKRMGGSAHQRDVVQCVAAMKRQRGEAVTQDLAAKVVEVFERYRDLFFRPFGEGSMRWALQPGLA
jgi:tRNA 2-selenouridine synthase SelU